MFFKQQHGQALRICLVSNTAQSIYHYRRGLVQALRAAGVELVVVAARAGTRDTHDPFSALAQIGCRCIGLLIKSKSTNPLTDLQTLAALYRCYRRIRPHLIFHYTIKPNIYGSIAAAMAGVPSIAVTTGLGHVFTHNSWIARIAKRLYRFAFRFPREVWFLNRDDLATFQDSALLARPHRARLLRSEGIDVHYFVPAPWPQKATIDFILIGRLLWDKGVGEYVEAARLLAARYPHARFALLGPIGAANPSAIAHTHIDTWQREGIVHYLGETHDVRPVIAASDCVVLPSYYREGVPRALLEAAAMARPSVTTDTPGCREVVEHGVTGLLCAARDPDALAATIAQIIDMGTATRAMMGARARAKVLAEFDEHKIIEHYFRTLSTLTGRPLTMPQNFEEKQNDDQHAAQ